MKQYQFICLLTSVIFIGATLLSIEHQLIKIDNHLLIIKDGIDFQLDKEKVVVSNLDKSGHEDGS